MFVKEDFNQFQRIFKLKQRKCMLTIEEQSSDFVRRFAIEETWYQMTTSLKGNERR